MRLFSKKFSAPPLSIYFFLILLVVTASFSPVIPLGKTFAQENLTPLSGGTYTDSAGNVIDSSNGQIIDSAPNDITPTTPNQTVTQGANSPGAGVINDAKKANAGKPNDEPNRIKGCIFPIPNIDACVANLVYLIMWIISSILWLSGIILNIAMQYTINLSDLMAQVPVVDIGWKIFRDLANILFIFGLLWIAIGMILGLNSGKTKELLANLIIVALLMNFSLFITKAVVDASNIIAIHFYNLIVPPGANFSSAFMEGLKIQTLYDVKVNQDQTFGNRLSSAAGGALRSGATWAVVGSVTGIGAPILGTVGFVWGGINGLFNNPPVSFSKIILVGFLGSLLMLTAAYVFFAAAILLTIRTVMLMLLMILSPVAFIAFALPSMESHFEHWKETLLRQCFFAPAYLALSYVVVKTIQSQQFKSLLNIENPNFAEVIASPGSANGPILIFNFALLIILMICCILVAKKMEAYGSDTVSEWGKDLRKHTQSFIGRNIVRHGGKIAAAPFNAVGGGLASIPGGLGQQLKKIPFVKNIPGVQRTSDRLISTSAAWEKNKFLRGSETAKNIGAKVAKYGDVTELYRQYKKTPFGTSEFGEIAGRLTLGALEKTGFGGEKSAHEAREESEELANRAQGVEKRKGAVEASADQLKAAGLFKTYNEPTKAEFMDGNGKLDQAAYDAAMTDYKKTALPNVKDYMNKDGEFDNEGFAAQWERFMDSHAPKLDDFDGPTKQADFEAAEKTFNEIKNTAMPDRDDEAFTHDKDGNKISDPEKKQKLFMEAVNKFAKSAEKMKEASAKRLKSANGKLSYAVGQMTPDDFANMNEHQIEGLAKFASLKQIKAVMASKEWTQKEKEEMVETRWKDEVNGYRELNEKTKAFEDAMQKVNAAIGAKQLEIDSNGEIKEVDSEGREQFNEAKDKFVLKNGETLAVPVEPELPKDLKTWARNKMTLPEYELAASVMPEMFDVESLVHVMRHGTIFRDIRTNENFNGEQREKMTYDKDSNLYKWLIDKDSPYYIPEDDEETRKGAVDLAEKAAMEITAETVRPIVEKRLVEKHERLKLDPPTEEEINAAITPSLLASEKDKAYRETYATNTPNDTRRLAKGRGWKSGRSLQEIKSTRGKGRNSAMLHKMLDAANGLIWKDADTEEVFWLLENLLKDYQAEEEGQGVVTDENRDLITSLMTDRRYKVIPRPVKNMDAKLQAVYKGWEDQVRDGATAQDFAFPSDGARGRVAAERPPQTRERRQANAQAQEKEDEQMDNPS